MSDVVSNQDFQNNNESALLEAKGIYEAYEKLDTL